MLATTEPTAQGQGALREALVRTLRAQRLDQGIQDALILAMEIIIGHIVRQADPPPTRLTVELAREDDNLFLEVRDNGAPPTDPAGEEIAADLQRLAPLFPDARYAPGGGGQDNHFQLRYAVSSGRPRVVVVDDDPGLRDLMRMYLKSDYEVLDFPDAASALSALRNQPAELVISDIHMPGMDGLTFRGRLADYTETHLLPFIFITSSDDEATLRRAGELGIDDYLLKPIRKRQLLAAVRRVLHNSRRVRERLGELLNPQLTVLLRPTPPPLLGGFRCALRTRSASVGGGDLLSFTPGGGDATLFLAQVLDRGPQAQVLAHAHAGYLAGLIRALPAAAGPADALARLSADVEMDPVLQASLIVCLALRLHGDGGVRLAGAGHPLPLLADATGATEVAVRGFPPGLLHASQYTEVALRLRPGQRLALYTDGLVEHNGASVMPRIRQALLDSLGQPLEDAADQVMEAADALRRRDVDATLVLLEPAA
ncbi:MAG: response regulator [Pseudomonadota bacterium]|nr:response regulator [Pseudomonadota bacterium]